MALPSPLAQALAETLKKPGETALTLSQALQQAAQDLVKEPIQKASQDIANLISGGLYAPQKTIADTIIPNLGFNSKIIEKTFVDRITDIIIKPVDIMVKFPAGLEAIGPAFIAGTATIAKVLGEIGAPIHSALAKLDHYYFNAPDLWLGRIGFWLPAYTGPVTTLTRAAFMGVARETDLIKHVAINTTIGGVVGLTSVRQPLTNLALDMGSDLFQGFINWVGQSWGAIWNLIAQGLQSFVNWLGTALDTIWQIINQLFTLLLNWFTQRISEIGEFIRRGIDYFITVIVPFIWQSIQNGLIWLADQIKNIANNIIAFVIANAPRTPTEARDAIVNVIGFSTATNLALWLTTTLIDLAHPVKTTGILKLADWAYAVSGLPAIGMALGDAVVKSTYMVQLERWANETFRPRIPSPQIADQMLFEENITIDTWRQLYRWYGWPEDLINAWQKSMYVKPSDRILIDMFTSPMIDVAWVRKKLREKGFSPDDIEVIVKYAVTKKIESLVRGAISDIIDAYVDGYVSIDRVMSMLQSYGYKIDDFGRMLVVLENARRAKEIRYAVDTIIADFKAGFITEGVAFGNLLGLGLSPAIAQSLIAKARISQVREDREAKVSALVEGFRRELISLDQLRAGLISLGISPARASAIAERERLRKLPLPEELRREEIRRQAYSLIEAYRSGAISEDAFVRRLVDLGYAPQTALSLARRLAPRVPTTREEKAARARETAAAARRAGRMPTLGMIFKAWRRGIIDDEELIQWLRDLGFDDDAITIVLASQLSEEELARFFSEEEEIITSIEQF